MRTESMNAGPWLTDRLADAAAVAPDRLGTTLEEVRRRGARRRRTRIGVTSAAVVLAVAGGTAGAAGTVLGRDGGDTVAAPSSVAGSPAGASAAWGPPPGADDGSQAKFLEPGTTVDTGEVIAGGVLTFWFGVRHDRFLQAVGLRGTDGKLALLGVNNDPDVAGPGAGGPGFHAGWEFGTGQDRFVTGYVVGDIATVTLTVDGTARTAKVAPWPPDPSVRVWWLRVPEAPGVPWQQAGVRDLTGRDAAGKVVAASPDGGVGPG